MVLTRSPTFVGLAVVLFLGVAVYFRLWSIDSTYSKEEADTIRRQFDLANQEAMEESAEWRLKYDEAVERSRQHYNEMIQAKKAVELMNEENAKLNKTLHMLQKENINLIDRVESMSQELENEKLKCNGRQIQNLKM